MFNLFLEINIISYNQYPTDVCYSIAEISFFLGNCKRFPQKIHLDTIFLESIPQFQHQYNHSLQTTKYLPLRCLNLIRGLLMFVT